MKTLNQFLLEGVNDPSIFKAIFIVGAPGSGKTTIGKAVTAGMGYKWISSDKIFEFIAGEVDLTDTKAADYRDIQGVRADARRIMYREKDTAVKGRMGILIDTPGYGDYVLKDKEYLESKGYETFMIFVKTTMDTSLERNQARDRKVPVDAVKSMFSGVMKNFKQFSNAFAYENFVVINNDGEKDEELIASIWKQVKKFSEKPITNAIAKAWMTLQTRPNRKKKPAKVVDKRSKSRYNGSLF